MYKMCKTEKSIERQKLFQTTLLELMKKQTYQGITVTSLCKEMQIPRKTFYRYYDTLEDVLHLLLDDTVREAFLYLEVRADLVGFYTYWKRKKSFLDVLERSGLSSLLVNRIYDRLSEHDVEKEITDEDLRFAGYVAAIMTILLIWHRSGMKQSPEEISLQVKHMFKLEN